MKIADNILKHHLRNVYFLAGTACGGKTTMSKLIAHKYGFFLYDEHIFSSEHREMTNALEQPAMMRKFPDWETYFNRPVQEYSAWLSDALAEELEMSLIDLIKLSQQQKVVADIHIDPEVAKRITEYGRIAFLVAEPELVVKDYYHRPDHRAIYDCIMGLPDPQKALQNCSDTLRYSITKTLQSVYESGMYTIKRDENSTVQATLALLEAHFGLQSDCSAKER